MRNLPKFYVLLCSVLLLSCGEKATQKERSSTTDETENNIDVATQNGLIMFYGTSLTAGLGLEQEQAYPALIQKKIDSLDLPYQVVNAGLSGETTAGGRSRLDWVLNQEVDVFVLELGANDGLRGVPVAESRRNLQAIIDAVREKNPNVKIILTGMQMPPNMGREYTRDFSNMFPELAEENDILLIPFLLENVGGIPELNQGDGIHPTAEGQKIMAETVWEVLKPELEE